MGPKIWSKKDKKGETAYSIRAIPVGGFVQLAGEGLDEDSKLPKDRLLQSKPIWQRFLVMFQRIDYYNLNLYGNAFW